MTNPNITVWSLPSCVQCYATKRTFNRDGIAYTERNLADHPEKAAEFREAGHTVAPIVETPGGTWHGYRPDMHKWIAATANSEN